MGTHELCQKMSQSTAAQPVQFMKRIKLPLKKIFQTSNRLPQFAGITGKKTKATNSPQNILSKTKGPVTQ